MAVGYTTTYNGRVIEVDDLLVKREYFNDGVLWTWGGNGHGQLGASVATTTSRSSPGTTAGAGINWVQAAGAFGTMAGVKSDGTLWTWGHNVRGQLGTNNTVSRSSPGTTTGAGTNWKQVSCGYQSTYGIKADGTLWTWGNNLRGQLGTNNTSSRSSPGQTIAGGNDWKQVAGGLLNVASVKTDGTLWTWGSNINGALGDGATTSKSSPAQTSGAGNDWKQVSVGGSNYFMAAVKTDGTLWTWGQNDTGQLGTGNISNRSSPGTTAGGGTNWRQVACGYIMTAAVKTDGTLWTWGSNLSGQLGDGTTTSRSSPGTTSGGGTTWKEAGAGWQHASGIKTDGTLWTWGNNAMGRLGTGNTTSRSSPGTTVGGITNWKSIVQHPSDYTSEQTDCFAAITDLTI